MAEQIMHPDRYNQGGIEPIDFICSNTLDFNQGSVIKYIVRHKRKGKADDILKAIEYCKFILKYDYDFDYEEWLRKEYGFQADAH